MGNWSRVFSRLETEPDSGALEAFLAKLGAVVRFEADQNGWFRAETVGSAVLELERFRADEEGIRSELNSWAAYLETSEDSPHLGALMERAIQARQLFLLRSDPPADRLREALTQELARLTEGFCQADGVGFFDAGGTLLVKER